LSDAPSAPEAPEIGVFQEMVGKCSELDTWSVFHMALCVTCFYCVDIEKAMNNEDDHEERALHVGLRKLVIETQPGRF
jgi:hypothetical protein